MSRLYLKANSDTRKTTITSRAHKELGARILWGSKHEPKLAVETYVEYPKDAEQPHVHIEIGENVEYTIDRR